METLVVAYDDAAKRTVVDLATEVEELCALDVDPFENAAEVESVTPLVINIVRYNADMHDVGVTYH